jgi:hypothetical protein
VDESYMTVVHWSTGTRKELVYKVPALTPSGKLTERLEHSRGNCPPVVHEVDRPVVGAYLQRKKAQDKKRRGGPGAAEVAGGGQPPLPPPQGAAAMVRSAIRTGTSHRRWRSAGCGAWSCWVGLDPLRSAVVAEATAKQNSNSDRGTKRTESVVGGCGVAWSRRP